MVRTPGQDLYERSDASVAWDDLPIATKAAFERDAIHSPTHDHPVIEVLGSDLDSTMTLVGESGGLSSIYEIGGLSMGLLVVETEHGFVHLDPDEHYAVLDPT